MFEPIGPTRKLPYPLYNQATGENVTPEEFEGGVFVWPDDPEERTIVPFYLSQREWTALGSAIDVGTDIAYPLQYIEVLRIWMRQTRYSVSICSAIIDCINNNPATRAAIVNALKSDADFNQYLAQEVYRLTEGQIGGKLLPGDCDDSVLAGRAIALVNRLDLNNQDFLEVMEVGTNDEERVADLIGAIPVAETFPVDEVFLIAQDFLEDFAENYNAASTEGRKDELARAIYCAMKETEDCSITFERLFTLFQEQALSGLTIGSTVGDIVLFLGTGDFSNDDAIFYGLMAIQIAFVLASRDFYGIEIGTISGIMRDALPSSRWEEWDPCGDDCTEYDFTVSDHGFTPLIAGYAVYVSGEGWARGTGVNVGRCGIQGAVGNYTSIQFEYNIVADNPTSIAGLIEYPYPPYVELTGFVNTTGQTVFTLTYTSSTGGVAFDLGTIVSGSAGAPLPEEWRLQRITVCR